MTTTLEHPQGHVHLEDLGDGRTHVSVEPFDPNLVVSHAPWTTRYPADLIKTVLDVKGVDHVCDEMRRDEDPRYVGLSLEWALLGYVAPEAFAGKRLLDFGCGCGASTMLLARMFPDTEIVGVELEADFIAVARKRAEFYGAERVRFLQSPSGEELPENLGTFDFVVLSAVFEHLLPPERVTVLEQIWSVLNPGGVLFLNQTPYRFYPHEAHTTGLPGLNFLPDRLALRVATRFSPRVSGDASWETLLRAGIRGGTEREVMRLLTSAGGGTPVMLEPTRLGLGDKVDLWYAYSTQARASRVKPVMRAAFKLLTRIARTPVVPALDLAIAKR